MVIMTRAVSYWLAIQIWVILDKITDRRHQSRTLESFDMMIVWNYAANLIVMLQIVACTFVPLSSGVRQFTVSTWVETAVERDFVDEFARRRDQ
mgnify:CR=1 FL=1